MFECDLHVHSIRSTCGFHTLFEIVDIMCEKGIRAFALTDHGPALGTPSAHFSVMLKRMPPVVNGIRVFKGIEASVMSVDGDLDMPEFEGYSYEVICAGIHPHDLFSRSQGIEANTLALINAMRKYPSLRFITHPCFSELPVNLDALTDVAVETGTALEMNNSHITKRKMYNEDLSHMLELAKTKGTLLAVNSDGHVFSEIGESDQAVKFMEQFGIESFNIVNRTLESTLRFLGLEE